MGCWNMLARTDRALIRTLLLAPRIMGFADFQLQGPRSNGMLGALMACSPLHSAFTDCGGAAAAVT
jgi:hypothetical protein